MQVHLKTLGCRLNEAELEAWSRDFQAAGHRITDDPASADLVVVNTCAVTAEAARKSRKLIRRSQRTNPGAKLVVTGCHTTLEGNGSSAGRFPGIDLVVGNTDKDRLVEIAGSSLDFNTMPAEAMDAPGQSLFAMGRQRAFIKVQDGCRYRCSFCIVTVARGAERSRPVHEVLDEINRLCAAGVREVVLTGVHIGGYGSDLGTDLAQLVAAALADTDIARLRLGSHEPWDLSESLLRHLDNPRFMPHLHLPLQSGSDSVLRRMSRRGRTGDFTRVIEQARAIHSDFNVTTDIMVGFPGETAAEWEQTLEYVEQVGFGHIHIFSYSPRAGTKAAAMPNQVDPATKRARSAQLHQRAVQLKRRVLERFTNRQVAVLLEGSDTAEHQPPLAGYTPNFLRVRIEPSSQLLKPNEIVELQTTRVANEGDCLIAIPPNESDRPATGFR
jgi:threonylcarbamoyladenosine tRNA methylthiotransferase MtaB